MRKLLAVLAGMMGVVLLLGLATLPARADAATDKAALDKLFDQLKNAPDAGTADDITRQIWTIWMAPADPELAGRMAAVAALEQAGDLPSAVTLLDKLVVDYPNYSEGWNQLATVEYELKNFDESLADIDKVLAIEPRHFGALSGRVLIYLAEGDHAKALKAMLAALAVHPFLAEKDLFPELSTATKV